METHETMFVREVARTDDPEVANGHVAGHRARRLIDGRDPSYTRCLVR